MMYLSKGVRVPSNDAGLFCVSHRGTTFPMGMQMSALWRNARNRPRPVPVGKEGAVLRLVEKGLAAITDEAITAHSVRIAELMKNHEHGVLATTTDKLLVDFVTRTTRRVNSDRLKKEHPSIYADVLNVSESRKVKVSIQPA